MYHSFFIHSSIEGHLARKSVESDPRCRRPTTSRIPESVEHVQAAINKDQRLTLRELEADLGIPTITVSVILTQDLCMKCVVAKFIPHILLPEQKEHHAAIANDLIQTTTRESDLAPHDFWLFPKLKSPLKGKRFQTFYEIQEK